MTTTTEDMKAELVANGYTLDDLRQQIVSPDAWQLINRGYTYAEQIELAHAHLQREQMTKDLMMFVMKWAHRPLTSLSQAPDWYELVHIEAMTLAQEHNITADESDSE